MKSYVWPVLFRTGTSSMIEALTVAPGTAAPFQSTVSQASVSHARSSRSTATSWREPVTFTRSFMIVALASSRTPAGRTRSDVDPAISSAEDRPHRSRGRSIVPSSSSVARASTAAAPVRSVVTVCVPKASTRALRWARASRRRTSRAVSVAHPRDQDVAIAVDLDLEGRLPDERDSIHESAIRLA
jgi:hypothetical protein